MIINTPWQKTRRQRRACDVLNAHKHTLLYGGARSTKTTVIVRNIVLRAIQKPSNHLISRLRFNHVKVSVWHKTFPDVMSGFFPNVKYHLNKSDWFIELPVYNSRKKSRIWFGGTDSRDRIEKILGNEYSTIYANECSQIDYDAITMLRTRLAENTGMSLRFYYDLNPCSKKHWTYLQFFKNLDPVSLTECKLDKGKLLMNPLDNPHLPPGYIDDLKNLPKRRRQRFLEGQYITDIEGALWTDSMISKAKVKTYSRVIRTVIAVDPAVSHTKNSDETGIIVCGIDEQGVGVVLGDVSIKSSTLVWAQRVVNVYHQSQANAVVVEVNNGGDLVRDVIKNVDSTVKVISVRASSGKFARAEPISELYELDRVAHAGDFPELEEQQTEYVPLNYAKSPDRLDALVWGLSYLMLNTPNKVCFGAI